MMAERSMDTPAWYQVAIMVAGWLFGWYLALRPQQYYDTTLPYMPRAVQRAGVPSLLIRIVGIFFIIINSALIAYAIAGRLR